MDIIDSQEHVYVPELDMLQSKSGNYPVTLLYMPLEWISNAQVLCIFKYGQPSLHNSRYGVLFSNQDQKVKSHITRQLKMDDPHTRLIMCSGTIGMGFHSPCITQVVHRNPPGTMIDLLQQVGLAG